MIVRLDPVELGRVEIRVERREGGTTIMVSSERNATLGLLARDLPSLHAALDRAGVAAAGRDIQLRLGLDANTTRMAPEPWATSANGHDHVPSAPFGPGTTHVGHFGPAEAGQPTRSDASGVSLTTGGDAGGPDMERRQHPASGEAGLGAQAGGDGTGGARPGAGGWRVRRDRAAGDAPPSNSRDLASRGTVSWTRMGFDITA